MLVLKNHSSLSSCFAYSGFTCLFMWILESACRTDCLLGGWEKPPYLVTEILCIDCCSIRVEERQFVFLKF